MIKDTKTVASEKELMVYRVKSWTGKVENNKNRALIWTELLGVKGLDVKTYVDQELNCKEIDIEIIDKDVPRSLNELYKDDQVLRVSS